MSGVTYRAVGVVAALGARESGTVQGVLGCLVWASPFCLSLHLEHKHKAVNAGPFSTQLERAEWGINMSKRAKNVAFTRLAMMGRAGGQSGA